LSQIYEQYNEAEGLIIYAWKTWTKRRVFSRFTP